MTKHKQGDYLTSSCTENQKRIVAGWQGLGKEPMSPASGVLEGGTTRGCCTMDEPGHLPTMPDARMPVFSDLRMEWHSPEFVIVSRPVGNRTALLPARFQSGSSSAQREEGGDG